jgi:hypothetical protein
MILLLVKQLKIPLSNINLKDAWPGNLYFILTKQQQNLKTQ